MTAALAAPALLAALVLHLAGSSDLAASAMLAIAAGASAESYEEVLFAHAAAPRAAMAVLVGAALGLAGSLLQGVTRNRLVSPLTIGASSGAWFALLLAAVLVPEAAARWGFGFAMAGALLAAGLALAVAGRSGLAGIPLVLAGMALHILFGALGTAVALLESEYVRDVFVWGAGDLTQTGWAPARALAPQVAIGLGLALLLAGRLTIMRLGAEAAAGRGLAVDSFTVLACLLALWMTASAIATVGIIGFVGLLAPNLARFLGARRVSAELLVAPLVGATVLLFADALAIAASRVSRDIVVTGASAALIGAPALLLLASRRLHAEDHVRFASPGAHRSRPFLASLLLAATGLLVAAAVFVGPTEAGWQIAAPTDFAVSLRWPRVLAALAAGAGMAVAGAILQRLLRNPLASPEILGISAGASLALVVAFVAFGIPLREAGPPVALMGSLGALAILLLVGRRNRNAPAFVALAGIALAATLDSGLRFVLARGGEDATTLLGWLSGSTFHIRPQDALILATAVLPLAAMAWTLHRWLTLLGLGDAAAAGRGLQLGWARLLLLGLAAALTGLVTAFVGPVAFVGLVAPHLATLLGARRAREQVLVGLLLGGALFVAADWAGRTALYPRQLPAGAIASVLGGLYLVALLARPRISRR